MCQSIIHDLDKKIGFVHGAERAGLRETTGETATVGENGGRADGNATPCTHGQGVLQSRKRGVPGRRETYEKGDNGLAKERELTAARLAEIFAARERDCHKGMFGTVGLFGGCVAYSGAAKLACLAASALRAGCGIARLAVPESIVPGVLPYLLESTLCPMPTDARGALRYDPRAAEDFTRGLKAAAVGMGWDTGKCDDAYHAYLADLTQTVGLSLLIDAGGITALSRDLRLLSAARARVLLTPHLGEFSRLTGLTTERIAGDAASLAEAFALQYGCVVLLKGHKTVVTDGRETYLVDRGGAGMATAGSGDVLSGILAGLLGYLPMTPETVAAGATLAGIAGEIAEGRMTDIAMVASDTVAALPDAIRRCRRGEI